ncbi:hypothetical protein Tco_1211948 [Tanacetum coccineum]
MILILKTNIMDPVMKCTTLPSHSESLKRFLFHFSRRSTRFYRLSHSEIVDIEKVAVRSSLHLPNNKCLALLIKSCSKSLVSLKVNPGYLKDALSHGVKLENLVGDALSHAVKLENLVGASFDEDRGYRNFRYPPNLRCLGLYDLQKYSSLFVHHIETQLRELNLPCIDLDESFCNHLVIRWCPNLEVLDTEDTCGDPGLQDIGHFCKNLRKLTYINRLGTHVGLIAVAQGCSNLEYLHVNLSNVSNEALECIGTNLKNLRNFYIRAVKEEEEGEI